MNEALSFAVRVFLRQGIWIAGAAWLLALGGRVIYARADRANNSKEDAPEVVNRKLILGAVVLAIGIVIAL